MYCPLLMLSVGWFLTGYCSRLPQQVVFSGEILSASQTQAGTELILEGEDFAVATLFTVADKLTSISSQGSTSVLRLNSGPEICTSLANSRLGEIGSLQFTCTKEARADFVTMTDTPLEFVLHKPTSLKVSVPAAGRINIQPVGIQDEFPASLQFIASESRPTETSAGPEDCAGTSSGVSPTPMVSLLVQNQPGTEISFEASGRRVTLVPWTSAQSSPRPLCFVIDSPGSGDRAIFTTLYRQASVPLSASYNVRRVELRQTNGRVSVGGEQSTLLSTDVLDVRSHDPGLMTLVNERINFEMPSAYSVNKGTIVGQGGNSGSLRSFEGTDIRRRWLETWAPWLQAILAVVISALGIQVVLPFIIPKGLRR